MIHADMNTRVFLSALGALTLLCAAARSARAEDPDTHRFTAELIWGTTGGKPPGQDLKPVTPDLQKFLGRIFKWTHYFRIEKKEFTVTPNRAAKVDMSKECRLELTQLTSDEFEIELYGKGLLVVRKRQRITPNELVVLGGDDKNDNAWFVVLTLARRGDRK